VTASSGTFAVAGPGGNVVILPANRLPFYSGRGVGGQLSLILPKPNLVFFFKYEDEYKAYSSPIGNTLVFGGAWTLKIPKGSKPPLQCLWWCRDACHKAKSLWRVL
jgi:hypothetical protein